MLRGTRSAARTTSQSTPKVFARKLLSTYKNLWHPDCSCCRDKVNRAAGRRAGALPARTTEVLNYITRLRHRSVGRVFCSPSGLFYRDPKLSSVTRTWYRQDSFIMTQNLSSTYRDWPARTTETKLHPELLLVRSGVQKTRHPDTVANSIKPPGR